MATAAVVTQFNVVIPSKERPRAAARGEIKRTILRAVARGSRWTPHLLAERDDAGTEWPGHGRNLVQVFVDTG